MKRTLLRIMFGLTFALAVPGLARVSAANGTAIRLAVLAPAGSTWDRVFRAWSNTLTKDTGGALSFQLSFSGATGDEREIIRRMKAGELDAGLLTSVGLGQVAKPTQVLQIPGVLASYKQLNQVREALKGEFDGMLGKEGFTLLGWADAGFVRQFAKKPILKPEDLKTARPWIPRDDPALPELMKVIGASGVVLGIPEVLPALQAGKVDALSVSAIAAIALQWFRHLTFVSKQAPVAIVAGTVMRQEAIKGLAPDHAKALLDSAKKAHTTLTDQILKEDGTAYKTLLGRGIKEFDELATPEQKKAWDDLHAQVIKRLTGKLWSKELLERVRAAAAEVK